MVSSVNHKLDTKGSHLNTAGASIVNGKSYNLIELKDVDAFLACNKVVHKVNRLITEYRKEQNELFDKGMNKKETDNQNIDTWRNGDIARGNCVALPKSSEIFRIKCNYEDPEPDEYATNLKVYLDQVLTNASVSCDDFSAAINKVNFE